MPAQEKIDAVAKLRQTFEDAQSLILADYRGLTVEEIGELRASCREVNVTLQVVKNRLAKIALRDAGLPPLDELLIGPTAVAFSTQDPVAPAKVLSDYAKKNKKVEIKGGLFEGEVIGLSTVQKLAALPSRDELVGRLAGSLASPMRNLAGALAAIPAGFARALKAVAEQKAA